MEEPENSILCPSCCKSSPEDADFCRHCRSPISSYAATGPFESIFAEGAAYREAINKPRKPIMLIGIWLIFLPISFLGLPALYTLFSLESFSQLKSLDSEFWITDFIPVFGSLFAIYVLFVTTKNYFKGTSGSLN